MKRITIVGLLLLCLWSGFGIHASRAQEQKGNVTTADFNNPPVVAEQARAATQKAFEAFEDKGDYYVLNTGERASFLRKKNTYILLKDTTKKATPPTFSPEAIQVQFGNQLDLVQKHSLGKLVMVKIKEKENTEAVLSSLRQADPTISFISPVLTSANLGGEFAVLPRIVVKIANAVSPDDVLAELKKHNLSLVAKLAFTDTEYELKIDNPVSEIGEIFALTRTVATLPNIHWAEPNFLATATTFFTPDDPQYADQWHLNNTAQNPGTLADADIDAPEGWNTAQGNGTVIAIYDDGVETTHEDLTIWSNPGETGDGKETNGIDDDGNGYIDDYQGWDFTSVDPDGPDDNDPNPESGNNHGTAVAGLAGATGNNGLGVTGSALGAEILPIRMTTGSCAEFANAMRYGGKYADVVSNSWGFSSPVCQSELDSAIADAVNGNIPGARRGTKGTPVLFATGNKASGWVRFTLSGVSDGTYDFRWRFVKDYIVSAGYDTVWLDNISWPGGTTTDFESETVGNVPDGFTTDGDANWTVVSDGVHAFGASGKSVKAGTITDDQETNLRITRAVGSGDLTFWVWVSSEFGYDFMEFYVGDTRYFQYAPGQYDEHVNDVGYPASSPNAIAVGASNDGIGGLEQRSYYSQFGSALDVVAPSSGGGYRIVTTDRTGTDGYDPSDYTTTFGGTSAATPLTAGVAAVIIGYNSELTAAQVRYVLRSGADQIGPYAYAGGRNDYYGSGRVNLNGSLQLTFDTVLDFGDAPDSSYPTLLAGNGARHTIFPGIFLGNSVDPEADGQPNATATGDDNDGNDDEDGVVFPLPPVQGQMSTVTITASGPGVLNAWLDFNANGDWSDAGEQIFLNTNLVTGANNLSFPVPINAVLGTTFARFRFSTVGDLSYIDPVEPAPDGEVEDYQVVIEEPCFDCDFGDAPNEWLLGFPAYPTFLASNGAHHVIVPGFFLGGSVDPELDGQPNLGATGDDGDGNNDDDGVTFTSLLVPGQIATITIAASAPGVLNAWLDFEGDLSWDETGDQIFTNQPLVTGNNYLTFQVPSTAIPSTLYGTFARFRFSTLGNLLYEGGPAPDGEVEDYLIEIDNPPNEVDFGDAPDPAYPTLLASNGAYHAISSGVYLGAGVDGEVDGQPTATADGDTLDDGVVFTSPLTSGSQATVDVTASGSGILNAWLDFNDDGDWADAGEQIFLNTPLLGGPGANSLAFPVPNDAVSGQTFARFRFSTVGDLSYDGGPTPDGEVEDYLVTIEEGSSEPRLLWKYTSGQASLWQLDADDVWDRTSYQLYGPYTSWTPRQYSQSPSDATGRLLWKNISGQVSIWQVDANDEWSGTYHNYGPYMNWTPLQYSRASDDGTGRLLWKNISGQVSIWQVDANDEWGGTYHNYGPYMNWTPLQYSRASDDGTGRLLWQHTSGQVSIWQVDANDVWGGTYHNYGPYMNWTPLQYSRAWSCSGRLLWQHTSGQVSIWQLGANDTWDGTSYQTYGPYTNWTFVQYEQASDCTGRLVWEHTSGQVSIWQVDANDGWDGTSYQTYGPYTGLGLVNYDRSGDGTKEATTGGMFASAEVEIRKAGAGNGVITVDGQVCGLYCTVLFVVYEPAASVMVQVEPAADSYFVRWENQDGRALEGIHYAQPGEAVYAVFEKKE